MVATSREGGANSGSGLLHRNDLAMILAGPQSSSFQFHCHLGRVRKALVATICMMHLL